jgi:hypothetical protein
VGHVRPLTPTCSDETRPQAGFFSSEENPQRLDFWAFHALVHFFCTSKCIYALTVYASMHILATKPLDKAAGNDSSLVLQEQAAMNRP